MKRWGDQTNPGHAENLLDLRAPGALVLLASLEKKYDFLIYIRTDLFSLICMFCSLGRQRGMAAQAPKGSDSPNVATAEL